MIKTTWRITLLYLAYATPLYTQLNVSKGDIKEPNVAGKWYPLKSNELKKNLKKLTSDAQKDYDIPHIDKTKIRALVMPHAGFTFSGTVAAAAARTLKHQKNYDLIIIIGPSHFAAFEGVALPHFTNYRIPFGLLKVDDVRVGKLKSKSLFHGQPNAFTPEHSIESILPFTYFFTHHSPILPLVIGEVTDSDIEAIAMELQRIITSKTLVVISTDMIHYGTSFRYTPFQDYELWRIRAYDSQILYALQQQDLDGFSRILTKTKATVCGQVPLKILIKLINLGAFGPCTVQLVAYDNSQHTALTMSILDDTQPQTVVSYASLIVSQGTETTEISTLEKRGLLQFARNVLLQSFHHTPLKQLLYKPLKTPKLNETPGVFVTLNKIKKQGKKELRGCIGNTTSTRSMVDNVADMTQAAAFQDPRFSPLQESELSQVLITISVLQPPHPLSSYHDIVLKKHGIILTLQGKSALFLPTVPEEFGFNLEETLAALSRKAGLPDNAWKSPDAQFQVFETIDFSEDEFRPHDPEAMV
jgi:AmmeMemoRadiSam system protein B/AmmeMemoRadiSam system protein A